FNDPYAERLAGEKGMAMVAQLSHPELMKFGIAMRTRFLDELLMEAITTAGLKTVVSVGAGLDTRPWRLQLPPELRWIEVDLPAMLDYKESIMANEPTVCHRERFS